jgi:hypothetical protein
MNRASSMRHTLFPYLTDSQSQESTMFIWHYTVNHWILHRRSVYKLRSNNEENAYSHHIEGHNWMTQLKGDEVACGAADPSPCTWLRVAPIALCFSLPSTINTLRS